MTALEWLDAVRADLDAVSRFSDELDESVTSREGRSVLAIASDLDDAHNALDSTAPERFDKMEKALRGVLERHVPDEVYTTACRRCFSDWPCPDVTEIKEVLGDE